MEKSPAWHCLGLHPLSYSNSLRYSPRQYLLRNRPVSGFVCVSDESDHDDAQTPHPQPVSGTGRCELDGEVLGQH